MTSAAVAKALGIEAGLAMPLSELEALLSAEEEVQARERALRLLGYRERSPEELRKRLAQDGYPSSIVDPLVERYVELELVDEDRFASMYASTRVSAGLGTRRIRRELQQRGVSDAAAEAAVSDLREGDLDRAAALLRGRDLGDRAGRERLLRRLISRGFDYGVAREAIARAVGAEPEGEPFIGE